MEDASQCEMCGGPLGREEELGLSCPRCLLALAIPAENVGRYDAGSMLPLGTTMGRYRIVRLIGDGGMGAVYEAEQESPRRTVALKVIKPEFTSLELLRRFEQEAQALGRLQHPGIAQIYEAGAADTGHGPQPYFAMEFIHGQSLREYADRHNLSARDRLGLLARVCDAVHHAHQRGLIHRDLKPDNILVDETGQPKVLDFGVARVTDGDMQATLYTGIGHLVGTLEYMSPEQVLGDPLALDTRSDVYALGVILYELLADRMPYTIGKSVLEAARTIRETDPARLSSFNRSYRGDIETIVAKALEKDKTRRYSSAAELAADIRRYLNDEPIVARPPSASYQLQKFARRNKALVTGAIVVLLVAYGATATWLAVGFSRERDRLVQAQKENSIERDRWSEPSPIPFFSTDEELLPFFRNERSKTPPSSTDEELLAFGSNERSKTPFNPTPGMDVEEMRVERQIQFGLRLDY
jgi:non-specific serine/threonine protein kinase/serine/threonine-protein kinase